MDSCGLPRRPACSRRTSWPRIQSVTAPRSAIWKHFRRSRPKLKVNYVDLRYDAQYENFRREVQEFLTAHWSVKRDQSLTKREAAAQFRAKAVDAGYLYRSVPRAYGGSEQAVDVLKAQIIRDEF